MRKYALMLFTVFGLFLLGCTLAGLGVGALIDEGKPVRVTDWGIVEIPKGQKIKVYRYNQKPIIGRFMGAINNDLSQKDSAVNVLLLQISGNRIMEIPVSETISFETRRSAGKIVGTLVGLSLDAIVIASLSGSKGFRYTGNSAGSSCPLLYSHDGSNYQLDAEIFAGSIFKAAERPDWDNLDKLEAHDGVYKLKMTNEFDETQQVDFIQLLAIDHLPNSRVYPSYNGEFYTVNNLQEPRAARDFYGRDIKDKLRRDNGAFWLSNPFGRDLNNPKELVDEVVLEFDRSVGTSSAALVLNVQNTMWASEAMRELLQLPGDALPEWYDKLNESPDARQQLIDFMIQEAMLKVSVWGESSWRPVGHVWAVGSAIAKDIVVELDLLGFHHNTLKVKLEAPPGMWVVNSVEIDYSYYNIPTQTQVLELQKATDQDGRDVLALMNKSDDQYYEMPTTNTVAYLEFPVVPEVKGMERSFILKGGGYYTIHMPVVGVPQLGLLQQMMEKKGTFTRYILEKLYQKADKAMERMAVVQ